MLGPAKILFYSEDFTDDGQLLDSWGSTGENENQFGSLTAIEIDRLRNDTIYIADSSKYAIYKIGRDGEKIAYWHVGDTGEKNGQTIWPEDLALDSAGNVYMLGSYSNNITKYSSDGQLIETISISRNATDQYGRQIYAFRIEVDDLDNLYVGYLDGLVRKFSSNGTYLTQVASSGSADGQVYFSVDMEATKSGENVFVLDGGNVRVQRFVSDASVVPEFGSLLFIAAGLASAGVVYLGMKKSSNMQ